MKVRAISALAGLASLCVLGNATQAAFVGVTIQNENNYLANHPNVNVRNEWNGLGGTLDVWRVYANFDGAGLPANNRVNAIFGAATQPFTLTSTNNSFFNVIDGTTHYDTPPTDPGNLNADPTRGYESYAGPAYVVNPGAALFVSPGSFDAAQANHLQGNFAATNFGVALLPPTDPAGNASAPAANQSPLAAGATGRVFLMQLTVADGVDIAGVVGVQTGMTGSTVNHWNANLGAAQTTAFTTVIPGPAGLALLALAGLSRRRARH